METPDTTPVQGDGEDVDMVDEPVFSTKYKVPNKRKKQVQWRGWVFLDTLSNVIADCDTADILILGGDFNCTTDDLDRNYAEPHVASRKRLWEVMEAHKLSDIWRTFNKNKRQYTWAHAVDNSLSLARLDHFYGFKHQLTLFTQCFIVPNQGISEIRKQTVRFYSKLYSSERSGAQIVEESFLKDLPKLSEQAARELDRELTLAELHKALQGMENGWAPGIDGIDGQDVLEVLRDSMNVGQLPLSCRRAVLTLLPKKGDLTHLKNWCPVSLLCTDIKLLSKALASRLTKVMEQITQQDQSYYQEKAFDRVEHEYLWKVLETFGFNPGFIAMIKVLFCEIESVLKVNGGLCAPFKVLRGIRQGCALSVLNKNWEGTVEHVKGRLSRWQHPVPRMSYRGRTLVINNLAASSLWHKLACVDLPPNLLASIQALLVDFFWDGLHWIPQSVLHLPKEEEGQGLVQLASRTAASSSSRDSSLVPKT
ncbi:hypothetical protein QTP70_027480 [Hemibagrus guttatus]|uniref:Endonuclease/exonuclease/phosphatase domain-containing protein n=1 Tax=Hemibagrus guttatus TaxID=175788 RepID=A0AAE0Q0V1_9TELE|nr:hypothetical protein QTP70_027480 [Hemibagrus guttatus]